MFSWLTGKPAPVPQLTSLQFPTENWKSHGEREPGKMRLWETTSRDLISLHFFPLRPDLPVVKSIVELQSFYSSSFTHSKVKILECSMDSIAGCRAIRLLLKVPQKPHGMTYQGAITIPFQAFSYVIKIQSPETDVTGIREAILLDRRLAKGAVPNVDGKAPFLPDWNPDSPEFDSEFPDHPLSRARRLMAAIRETATLDKEIKKLPGFPLPNR